MLTTHYFNSGSRRCIHCGLAEDDVEFKVSCPSPNAKPARVPMEFDFVTTRFEVPIVDMQSEWAKIAAADLMRRIDEEMTSMVPTA